MNKQPKPLILKILAVFLGIAGVILLVAVIFPLVGYNFSSREKYPLLLNPEFKPSNLISGGSKFDDKKADTWFVGTPERENPDFGGILFYTISIPKLKIKDAVVEVGGNDLEKSLVHFKGTAIPGQKGNAVIFGHSILPVFYNPKNYISIFSKLPTLKKGDEISVDYDGVYYQFKVEAMFEVMPTDIQVLEQDKSDSFLTLVTCVPPGDPRNPRRLIVRARIMPPEVD